MTNQAMGTPGFENGLKLTFLSQSNAGG